MAVYFESFRISETIYKMIEQLPDDAMQLRFYKSVMAYGMYGKEPLFSGLEAIIFIPMRDLIDNSKARAGAPVGNHNAKKGSDNNSDAPKTNNTDTPKSNNTSYIEGNNQNNEKTINIIDFAENNQTSNVKDNVNDKENVKVNDNVNEFADKSAPTQLEPAESSPEEIPQGEEITVPEPVIYLDLEKKQGTPEIIPENQLYFPEPEIIHVPEISHGSEKQPDKPEKTKRAPLREREPVNDMEILEKCYLGMWDVLFEDRTVKTPNPILDWGKTRALEKQALEKYGFDAVHKALCNAVNNQFVLQTGFDLSKILSVGVLSGLINGSTPPKKSGQGMSVNDAIPADMIIY